MCPKKIGPSRRCALLLIFYERFIAVQLGGELENIIQNEEKPILVARQVVSHWLNEDYLLVNSILIVTHDISISLSSAEFQK